MTSLILSAYAGVTVKVGFIKQRPVYPLAHPFIEYLNNLIKTCTKNASTEKIYQPQYVFVCMPFGDHHLE